MKEGPARRSFRLKVEALEKAASDGVVPEDLPVIGNVGDLRTWNDPPMTSWSSHSVAAPGGPNSDLRFRFDRILPTFVKLQTGKVKRGPLPPKGMSVTRWLILHENAALIRQNAELLVRVKELEIALRVERTIVESSKAKIGELTATLRTLAPLNELRRTP